MFHKECFASNKDDDYGTAEEKFDDPEDLLISPTDSREDFYLGEMDQNNAKKRLKPKRRGTFLVRFSKGRFVISKKPHKNDPIQKEYDHLFVSSVTSSGEEWLFIDKGFAFKNIDDLIKHHRKSHKLYFPINSPDSELTEVKPMAEEIKTRESDLPIIPTSQVIYPKCFSV